MHVPWILALGSPGQIEMRLYCVGRIAAAALCVCLSERAAITTHHILCLTTATNNEDDDTLKMLLVTLSTSFSTKLPNNFDTAMYPINSNTYNNYLF